MPLLYKALNSVVETISGYEFEYLFINDGSKDNSIDILNEYAAKDSRFKIFTQDNQGAGIARNFGIKQANGECLKVPHMGWNSLHFQNNGRLFAGLPQDSYVYFVHSYYLQAEDESIVKATTDYSTCIHASVEKNIKINLLEV